MEEIAKRKDTFISDTDKFGGAVIMNTIFISEPTTNYQAKTAIC